MQKATNVHSSTTSKKSTLKVKFPVCSRGRIKYKKQHLLLVGESLREKSCSLDFVGQDRDRETRVWDRQEFDFIYRDSVVQDGNKARKMVARRVEIFCVIFPNDILTF